MCIPRDGVGLDVLDPRVGGVPDVDASAVVGMVAALEKNAFEAGVLGDRLLDRRDLRFLRLGERPVQRRRQGERVAVDGGDLDALADRAVGAALEVGAIVRRAVEHRGIVGLIDLHDVAGRQSGGRRESDGGRAVGGVGGEIDTCPGVGGRGARYPSDLDDHAGRRSVDGGCRMAARGRARAAEHHALGEVQGHRGLEDAWSQCDDLIGGAGVDRFLDRRSCVLLRHCRTRRRRAWRTRSFSPEFRRGSRVATACGDRRG